MSKYRPGQRVALEFPMPETRYAIAKIATRFEDHDGCQVFQWFVQDAEITDPITGRASVVGQFYTREDAVKHVEKLVRC